MAKTSNNPRRERSFEGLDQDALRRELGFDDLSYEACFCELFGDVFDLRPKPGSARVTQMGPGHRSRRRPTPETTETEVEPELENENEEK